MKKILSCVLCLALIITGSLALSACGKKDTLTGDYNVSKMTVTYNEQTMSATRAEYEALKEKQNPTLQEQTILNFGEESFQLTLKIDDSKKTFELKESEESEQNIIGTYERDGSKINAKYTDEEEEVSIELVLEDGKIVYTMTVGSYTVQMYFAK